MATDRRFSLGDRRFTLLELLQLLGADVLTVDEVRRALAIND